MQLLAKLTKRWQQLNDVSFVASLEATRKRHQIIALKIFTFVHPLYIFVDKSMFPIEWMQPQFLGVRLAISVSAFILLLRRSWRESQALFLIPMTLLLAGIPFMVRFYPSHQMNGGYSGGTLVIFGFCLIAGLSLRNFILYMVAIYLSCFHIWAFDFPQSFAWWMSDGGFLNFSMAFMVAIMLYLFRLSLSHDNYVLVGALEEKSTMLEVQARDVQSILHHIPQGVCLIKTSDDGQNLEFDSHQSFSFQAVLKKQGITEQNAVDLVFAKTDIPADTIKSIDWILKSALGDAIFQWDLNAHALPAEFRMHYDSGSRLIEADWNAVPDEEGVVRKILVLLKDVTELRQQQEDIANRNRDAKRLTEFIANSPSKIREFLAFAEPLIQDAVHEVQEGQTTLAVMYRNVHTLKGMARTYHLDELIHYFHALEEQIALSQIEGFRGDILAERVQDCEKTLHSYRDLFDKVYSSNPDRDKIQADPQVVLSMIRSLEIAIVTSRPEEAVSTLHGLRNLFAVNLERIIGNEIAMLEVLAAKLAKPCPRLVLKDSDMDLSDAAKHALRKAFVHIFRNSIDHGIEIPELRLKRGKNPEGQITLEVFTDVSGYRIRIRDDGKGLALREIEDKARRMNVWPESAHVSVLEVAESIFLPGVTTARYTNEISGRGIGMDAVRAFLLEVGGDIHIQTDDDPEQFRQFDHASFAFEISLPKNHDS